LTGRSCVSVRGELTAVGVTAFRSIVGGRHPASAGSAGHRAGMGRWGGGVGRRRTAGSVPTRRARHRRRRRRQPNERPTGRPRHVTDDRRGVIGIAPRPLRGGAEGAQSATSTEPATDWIAVLFCRDQGALGSLPARRRSSSSSRGTHAYRTKGRPFRCASAQAITSATSVRSTSCSSAVAAS
jgi:hypothetical protein